MNKGQKKLLISIGVFILVIIVDSPGGEFKQPKLVIIKFIPFLQVLNLKKHCKGD